MLKDATVSAIVNCAGRGERFGGNKLLATIGGMTVLEKTIRCFMGPIFDEVVVTVRPECEDHYRRILIDRAGMPVELVSGAEERYLSAQQGLQATTGSLVLVHDGVRPFVTQAMIEDVLLCGLEHGAAMLGVPSVVQVKLVTEDLDVQRSLDREHTWLGQTPQVFHRHLLERAYAGATADHYSRISDDADLVAEYTGHTVKIVRGSGDNIKITTPMDLVLADLIAERMSP